MTKSKTQSDVLNTDRPENHLLTYMQPTIRTIELHSSTTILAGSDGLDGSRNGYGDAIEEEWP